jgi:hypothetical protein
MCTDLRKTIGFFGPWLVLASPLPCRHYLFFCFGDGMVDYSRKQLVPSAANDGGQGGNMFPMIPTHVRWIAI